MAKFKKDIIKLLFVIGCVAMAFVVANFQFATGAKADLAPEFMLVQGASLRMPEQVDEVINGEEMRYKGLRFTTRVNEAWFENNESEFYEFGTLVFPTKNGELDTSISVSSNRKNLDAIQFLADTDGIKYDGYFTASVVYDFQTVKNLSISAGLVEKDDPLIDDKVELILNKLYLMDLTAVSYVVTDSGVIYTNSYTTSMTKVAIRLYKDPSWISLASNYLNEVIVDDAYVSAEDNLLVVKSSEYDAEALSRIVCENEDVEFTVVNGKVALNAGFVNENVGKYVELCCVDENNNVYILNVFFANKALKTAQDVEDAFDYGDQHIGDNFVRNDNNYVLANDIDMTGVVMNNRMITVGNTYRTYVSDGAGGYVLDNVTSVASNVGYNGVFDGMGHVISNVTIEMPNWSLGRFIIDETGKTGYINAQATGFFAYVREDAEIRNVAFVNVYGTGSVNVNYGLNGLLGVYMYGTLENVYFEANVDTIHARGPFANYNENSVLRNVVINYPKADDYTIESHLESAKKPDGTSYYDTYAYGYGAMSGHTSPINRGAKYENVFVVSPMPINLYKKANSGYAGITSVTYAENETDLRVLFDYAEGTTIAEAIEAEKSLASNYKKTYQIKGVRRYDTMELAGQDTSYVKALLDTGLFKVSNGQLSWHSQIITLDEIVTENVDYDASTGELFTTALAGEKIVKVTVDNQELTVANGGVIDNGDGTYYLRAKTSANDPLAGINFRNNLNTADNSFSMVVETENGTFTFNKVHYYTMIINSAGELKNALDYDYSPSNLNNFGLFKLGNDIEISEGWTPIDYTDLAKKLINDAGTTVSQWNGVACNAGFGGVFDGAGYTIDFNGHSAGNYGIFGSLSTGAQVGISQPTTIKNLAIINYGNNGSSSYNFKPIIAQYGAQHTYNKGALLENIYVTWSVNSVLAGLIYEPNSKGTIINNVLVDIEDNEQYGSRYSNYASKEVFGNDISDKTLTPNGYYGGTLYYSLRRGTTGIDQTVTNFISLGRGGLGKTYTTATKYNTYFKSTANGDGTYNHVLKNGGWSGTAMSPESYYTYAGNQEYGDQVIMTGMKAGFASIAKNYANASAIKGYYCATCGQQFSLADGSCSTCGVALTYSADLWKEAICYTWKSTKLSEVNNANCATTGEVVVAGASKYDSTAEMKEAYAKNNAIFDSFIGDSGNGLWQVVDGKLVWGTDKEIKATVTVGGNEYTGEESIKVGAQTVVEVWVEGTQIALDSLTASNSNVTIVDDIVIGSAVGSTELTLTFTVGGKTQTKKIYIEVTHNYGDLIDGTPATCFVDGTISHYVCLCCGKYFNSNLVEIEAEYVVVVASHDYGEWIGIGNGSHYKTCAKDNTHVIIEKCTGTSASCTENGVCDVCGSITEEALGHIGGIETCEQGKICERCRVEYTDALGHNYNQQIVTDEYIKTAANCTEPAVYYYACVNCGGTNGTTYVYGEALGHTGGAETCEHGKICDRCRVEYTDALGHNYTDKVTTERYLKTAANCNDAAVYYYACANCGGVGDSTYVYGEALGHTGGVMTCEQGKICDRCRVEYTEALGHNYTDKVINDGYIKTAANCTEAAVYYYACVNCGETDGTTYVYGEALGHTGGVMTCEQGRICSRCSVEYTEALGHNYTDKVINDGYIKTAASCTEAAVYYYACVNCGETNGTTYVYGEALGHTGGTVACEQGKICERCSVEYTEALGHSWNGQTCDNCGKSRETIVISDAIDYDASTGELLTTALAGNVTNVTLNGVALTIENKNGAYVYTGAPVIDNHSSETQTVTFEVETSMAVYVLDNVKYWAMIINDGAELKTALDMDYTVQIYNHGFYKLGNNIVIDKNNPLTFDYVGYGNVVKNRFSAGGFAGVFDGAGHTLNFNGTWLGSTAKNNGLFGNFNTGGDLAGMTKGDIVVKDLAIVNVSVGGAPSTILLAKHGKNHHTVGHKSVVIENLYVNSLGDVPGGLFYDMGTDVKLNNVFIDLDGQNTNLSYYSAVLTQILRTTDEYIETNVTNFVALGHEKKVSLGGTAGVPTVANYYKAIKSTANGDGTYTHTVSHGGWNTGNTFGREYYYAYAGGNREYGNALLVQGLKPQFAEIAKNVANSSTAVAGYYCATCGETFSTTAGTCAKCSVELTYAANLWAVEQAYVVGYTKLSEVNNGDCHTGANGELVLPGAYTYYSVAEMQTATENGALKSFIGNSGNGLWQLVDGRLTWLGAHAHDWTAPSCDTAKTCSICGITSGEPLGHTGGKATCEVGAICDVCGDVYTDALGHTGGKATCQERAVCSVCNQPYGDYASHDYQYGYNSTTHWLRCSVCKDDLVYGSHEHSDKVLNKEPTCTEEGEYLYLCECGHSIVEYIDMIDHSFGAFIDEVPATCTTTGIAGHYVCQDCGCNFNEYGVKLETIVLPVSHTFRTYNQPIAPTCTESGNLGHYKCEDCGKYFNFDKNEVTYNDIFVPATGHVQDGSGRCPCGEVYEDVFGVFTIDRNESSAYLAMSEYFEIMQVGHIVPYQDSHHWGWSLTRFFGDKPGAPIHILIPQKVTLYSPEYVNASGQTVAAKTSTVSILSLGANLFNTGNSDTDTYYSKVLNTVDSDGNKVDTLERMDGYAAYSRDVGKYTKRDALAGNPYGVVIKSVILPEGLIMIRSNALANTEIKELVIPNSVIGGYPSKVDNLPTPEGGVYNRLNYDWAITNVCGGCTQLESVTIGSGIETLGGYAFYGCSNLKKIKFVTEDTDGDGVADKGVKEIRQRAFGQNDGFAIDPTQPESKAGRIVLPETLISVPESAIDTPNVNKKVRLFKMFSPEPIYFLNITKEQREALEIPALMRDEDTGELILDENGNKLYVNGEIVTNLAPNGLTNYGYTDGWCGNAIIYYKGEWYYDEDGYARAYAEDEIVDTECDFADSYYMMLNDGTLVGLTEEGKKLTSITVPSSINGVAVRKIATNAFKGANGLTSLVLPSSVTTIEEFGLAGLKSLTSVTVTSNLSTIGRMIFRDTTNVTSLTVKSASANVSDIVIAGTNEIANICNNLGAFTLAVSASNYTLTTADEVYILDSSKFVYTDDNVLVAYLGTSTNITIYDFIVEIGDSVFEGRNITKVTIPSSVTKIGDRAFKNSLITEVSLPENLTYIGEEAFFGTDITSISIPNGVTAINKGTFQNCGKLKEIEWGGVTEIGYAAFEGCYLLTSVEVPEGVTSIGDYAFYGDASIRTIKLPSTLKNIGNYAFAGLLSIYKIDFAGTMADWRSIKLNLNNWNYLSNEFEIRCVDGIGGYLDVEYSVDLTIGQNHQINYSVIVNKYEPTEIFTWSSSDESVVKVDNNGRLTAIDVGTAVVTLNCKYGVGVCYVTVTYGSVIPVLNFEYPVEDNDVLEVGSSFSLNPYVAFGRVKFTDVVVEYEIANENVATINQNGVITTHATGTTKVVARGTWRNFSASEYYTLEVEFDITVVGKVAFKVNGNLPLYQSVYAPTAQTIGMNEFSFVPSVTVDGLVYVPTVTLNYLNGATTDDIVYDKVNKKLIGYKLGKAEVILSYDAFGVKFINKFIFEVLPNTVTFTEDLIFSSDTGLAYHNGQVVTIAEYLGIDDSDIVRATYEGGELFLDGDGTLLGMTQYMNGYKYTSMSVYTDTAKYIIPLKVATRIISTPEEFIDAFGLDRRDGYVYNIERQSTKPIARPEVTLNGYYVLANDIDFSDYVLYNNMIGTVNDSARFFAGVLDGQGYVISNAKIDMRRFNSSIYSQGLFGTMTEDSVIKNVAFTNLKAYSSRASDTDVGLIGVLAYSMSGTLENVYIEIASDTFNVSGLARNIYSSANLTNVVVTYDYPNYVDNETTYFAIATGGTGKHAYGSGSLAKNVETTAKMDNVYVISQVPIRMGTNSGGSKFNDTATNPIAITYGENETDVYVVYDYWLNKGIANPTVANTLGDKTTVLNNVRRYNTLSDMAADKSERNAEKMQQLADSGYWVINTNNEIVWASLAQTFSNGHNFKEPTCTDPKTCTICGLTEGESLGRTHEWIGANCTTAKTCSYCGDVSGEALGHDWSMATCTTVKTCKTCGVTTGGVEHQWVEATCTDPKTCKSCGLTEGNALGHVWQNYWCSRCWAIDPRDTDFVFAGDKETIITTIDGVNYAMPNAAGVVDNSSYGSLTIGGQSVYYPIITGEQSKSSGTLTRYYYLLAGVSITEYDASNKVTATYDSLSSAMPSTVAIDSNGTVQVSGAFNGNKTNPYVITTYNDKPVLSTTYDVSSSGSDAAASQIVLKFTHTDHKGDVFVYYVGYKFDKVSKETVCVTGDTLVTLADGSKKQIQDVTYEDQLLVWDFYNGKYSAVSSAIIFNHGYDYNAVITLNFSDGTQVKVVNLHQFFSADLNKFVSMNANNVSSFVGGDFVKKDGEGYTAVKLVSYDISEEYIDAYGIISGVHYNVLVEDMFSTDFQEKDYDLFNYFAVGDGMKFDEKLMQEDIENCGVYTYEDFADYLTYDEFVGFNVQYFKIAVNKGDYTYEEILSLIEEYLKN